MNREKMREYSKKWRQENREKMREHGKADRIRIKETLLKIYGRECTHCGDCVSGVLTLDHINNDGARERLGSRSPHAVYKRAIKNPDHKKYQMLCFNCNCTKHHRPEVYAQLKDRFRGEKQHGMESVGNHDLQSQIRPHEGGRYEGDLA